MRADRPGGKVIRIPLDVDSEARSDRVGHRLVRPRVTHHASDAGVLQQLLRRLPSKPSKVRPGDAGQVIAHRGVERVLVRASSALSAEDA